MSYEESEIDCVDFPCPHCSEDRADLLEWQDDESVLCRSCGRSYRPAGYGPPETDSM